MVLYFDDIGNKNPIVDFEVIKWYLSERAKHTSKSQRTRFWLNMQERYYSALINSEAYELLDFIKSQTTAAQKKNRAKWRIAQMKKSKQEIENWSKIADDKKIRYELISKIGMN